MIHGTTPQNCEEIHRSIDDALQTLRALAQNDSSALKGTQQRGRLVLGGGCIEFNISMRMRQIANRAEGIAQVSTGDADLRLNQRIRRRLTLTMQFIFHSYAESLLSVPKVLSGNAGSDSDVTGEKTCENCHLHLDSKSRLTE